MDLNKIKVWQLFLVALAINGIFGYLIGGVEYSGRYVGQTLFYGMFVIFGYYVILHMYKAHKKNKNLIFRE